MLRERITSLFTLLQCTNTDIARHAGCSSGNISKLKSGNRTPKPTSHSIVLLAEGVYRYADYENLLPVLAELAGSDSTDRKTLIPALIAWLYETDEIVLPARSLTPKSKRLQAYQRQSFGEKLDRAMAQLNLSNRKLAELLNIDISLVSRYRRGLCSPAGNAGLSEKLADVLVTTAVKTGKIKEFAELCGTDADELDADAAAQWLFLSGSKVDSSELARHLLSSLDDFKPGNIVPEAAPQIPSDEQLSCCRGTEGLRKAVIRFLSDAAREGGKLLLYSDEPMDWMIDDKSYFELWASLMAKCVRRGVKIKIIHNVDRDNAEMVDAIRGWLPLYVSGMIEPYVFRRQRNPRFYHTVFLRSGGACIYGFYPAGTKNGRWYEYLTDPERLNILQQGYEDMLFGAAPFLRTYSVSSAEEFYDYCKNKEGKRKYLLNALPVFTMPESLYIRLLSRIGIDSQKQADYLASFRSQKMHFHEILSCESIDMVLCLQARDPERILLSFGLTDLTITCTPEEYAEQIDAMIDLVQNEKNFHLTLLPSSQFRDIQLLILTDALVVLNFRTPQTAFVFQNSALTDSVSAYFSGLTEQYASDRHTVVEMLKKIAQKRPCRT